MLRTRHIFIGLVLAIAATAITSVVINTDWSEMALVLGSISWYHLLGFFVLIQVQFMLFTWRWQMLLASHKRYVAFWKLWLYRLAGYSVSYITPTQVGGEPVRIFYLRQYQSLPLQEASASVLLDKLIELGTFALFISLGVFVVAAFGVLPEHTLYPVLSLVGMLLAVAVYLSYRLFAGKGFLKDLYALMARFFFYASDRILFVRFLSRHACLIINSVAHPENTCALQCLSQIILHPSLMIIGEKIKRTDLLITQFVSSDHHSSKSLPLIVGVSFLAWFMLVVEFLYVSYVLNLPINLVQAFTLSSVPLTAYLLPVPAGLGMFEAVQVGLFAAFSFSAATALAVVVFLRCKELVFASLGGIYLLTHSVKRAVLKDVNNKEKPSQIEPSNFFQLKKPSNTRFEKSCKKIITSRMVKGHKIVGRSVKTSFVGKV